MGSCRVALAVELRSRGTATANAMATPPKQTLHAAVGSHFGSCLGDVRGASDADFDDFAMRSISSTNSWALHQPSHGQVIVPAWAGRSADWAGRSGKIMQRPDERKHVPVLDGRVR